jgi:hypothetical protein
MYHTHHESGVCCNIEGFYCWNVYNEEILSKWRSKFKNLWTTFTLQGPC